MFRLMFFSILLLVSNPLFAASDEMEALAEFVRPLHGKWELIQEEGAVPCSPIIRINATVFFSRARDMVELVVKHEDASPNLLFRDIDQLVFKYVQDINNTYYHQAVRKKNMLVNEFQHCHTAYLIATRCTHWRMLQKLVVDQDKDIITITRRLDDWHTCTYSKL